SWRRLQNERKATIGVDRDENRKDHSVRFLLGLGVELFAEIHNVQAMRTERGADRRRRSGFARGQLQLDGCLYFLWRHVPFTFTLSPQRGEGSKFLIPAFLRWQNRARSGSNGRKSLRKPLSGCGRCQFPRPCR